MQKFEAFLAHQLEVSNRMRFIGAVVFVQRVVRARRQYRRLTALCRRLRLKRIERIQRFWRRTGGIALLIRK